MGRWIVTGVLTVLVGPMLAGCASTTVQGHTSPGDQAWVATGASVTEPGDAVTPVDLTSRTVEPKVHVGSLPSAMAFTNGDAALG